jgi:tetratricopeptide (TPR) repeat protein
MKTIRIFISSPGDVKIERDKARKVVDWLQKRYAGRLRLETVLWEDLPLGAVDSFQGGIDMVLKGEQAIDIAVFILWSRLGSPLGAAIRKPDGSEYRSGTEREFDLMLAARALLDAPAGAMVGIGPEALPAQAVALPTAEKAVALHTDDKPHPARLNLGHAYLLNGQFEKAKAIYEKYLGNAFDDGRKWNDELRNDFKALRAAGRDHPDVKMIEALLEQSQINAP